MIQFQVHAYKHMNEHEYIHFKLFRQDSYKINEIEVDGLFTAFTGSLHNFQASTTAPGSNCFIDPPSWSTTVYPLFVIDFYIIFTR